VLFSAETLAGWLAINKIRNPIQITLWCDVLCNIIGFLPCILLETQGEYEE
jgi:hypothetical protein